MAETVTPHPPLKTCADHEAATRRCLEEIDRLQGLIRRDQMEINRLKTETRAILDKLRATAPRKHLAPLGATAPAWQA